MKPLSDLAMLHREKNIGDAILATVAEQMMGVSLDSPESESRSRSRSSSYAGSRPDGSKRDLTLEEDEDETSRDCLPKRDDLDSSERRGQKVMPGEEDASLAGASTNFPGH